MLSLPCIVEHSATPYVALRKRVTLPFDDEIPGILARLSAYLAQHGLPATGPVFFKHNVVDMPDLEMEFGVALAQPVEADGEFTSGMLPAGRYAEIEYTGAYDDLLVVNAVLIHIAGLPSERICTMERTDAKIDTIPKRVMIFITRSLLSFSCSF